MLGLNSSVGSHLHSIRREKPGVDDRSERLGWQVSVLSDYDRRRAVGRHHLHGADGIKIVQPNFLARCDVNHTPLSVWLFVTR